MNTVSSSPLDFDVAAIEALEREACVERWLKQFGREPAKYVSVQFLRRALAYEAQLRAFGGYPPVVRRALERSLKDAQKSTRSAGSVSSASSVTLRPGTHLVREWNGRSYQVEVLESGFQLDGKRYRSLSAIARKITGAHWSGPRFFGMANP